MQLEILKIVVPLQCKSKENTWTHCGRLLNFRTIQTVRLLFKRFLITFSGVQLLLCISSPTPHFILHYKLPAPT